MANIIRCHKRGRFNWSFSGPASLLLEENNVNTVELRASELAIETILQGDYWSASRAETDDFINYYRKLLKDRGIEIVPSDYANVEITFPPLLNPTPTKRQPYIHRKPETVEEAGEGDGS